MYSSPRPDRWRLRARSGMCAWAAVATVALLGCSLLGCSLDGAGTGPAHAREPGPMVAGDGPRGADEVPPELGPGPVDGRRDDEPARPWPSFDGGAAVPGDAAATLDAGPAMADGAGAGDGAGARDETDAAQRPLPNVCDLGGTFALRVDFDVTWLGSSLAEVLPVIAPGAGTLTVYASVHAPGGGTGGQATVAPCGAAIPDFVAGDNVFVMEHYGVYFPDESWERPTMPRWTIQWHAQCEAPGCGFRSGPLDALIGARKANQGRGFSEIADDDGDGQPGVTLLTRGPSEVSAAGDRYAYPPLGWQIWARAQKLMLAIALRLQLEGALESCDVIRGTVPRAEVITRALACTGSSELASGELACDAASVQFLDENLPAWSVQAARFAAVRVRDGACHSVRSVLP